jgi:hypothetical protein
MKKANTASVDTLITGDLCWIIVRALEGES